MYYLTTINIQTIDFGDYSIFQLMNARRNGDIYETNM